MPLRRIRSTAPVSVVASLAAAAWLAAPLGCGSDDAADPDAAPGDDAAPRADADPDSPDAAPPAAGCTPTESTDFALELVADGLDQPVFVTAPADDPRMFILEQPGRIRIVEDGELLATPFLDITGLTTTSNSEQGLLGLAFHPDYDDNGRFFVNYTAASPADATVVAEYQVSSDANGADEASEQRLLEIGQPNQNHNGGMIEFGDDGYLYIGMGDGGGAGDPDDNGQELQSLLGSMLRIDVDDGDGPYGIPEDNPFAGDEGALDEIWAYGLRNPWRWSFDRAGGTLLVADVGQSSREEVNAVDASAGGINYGWPCREGSADFRPTECDAEDELTDPVYDYENTGFGGRCSVTGGYVYRGECLLGLEGRYVFADYCSSEVWSFELAGGDATGVEDLTQNIDPAGDLANVSSFGEDAYGELYITSHGSGEVYRIIAEDAD